jgi:two-component system chemotaxis response regulator CheY
VPSEFIPSHSEAVPVQILIVDDEPELRSYIRGCLRALRPQAAHVFEAADGNEALQRLREGDIHLIIADVVMPRLDGYALCRILRADASLRHIPIMLVTGEIPPSEAADEALAAGASALLPKPFNAHLLCERVTQILHPRAPPA